MKLPQLTKKPEIKSCHDVTWEDNYSWIHQKDILEENSLIITLEAGSVMSWQKYIKNKGANLGIDKFGESAPYKEVYKHFKLSEEDITNFIQKKLRE